MSFLKYIETKQAKKMFLKPSLHLNIANHRANVDWLRYILASNLIEGKILSPLHNSTWIFQNQSLILNKTKGINILWSTLDYSKISTKDHPKQVKDPKVYRIVNTNTAFIKRSMTIIHASSRRHIGFKRKKSTLSVLTKVNEMKTVLPLRQR